MNKNLICSLIQEVDDYINSLKCEAEERHGVAVFVEKDVRMWRVLPSVALFNLGSAEAVTLALIRNIDRSGRKIF